ncbi:MAG TPA: hypothetical protein VGX28_12010 [Frankiaceae bacterium]|jgi:hypothetical protein|nr:hypothetical protein [Frankiaceae bacterium]
MTTTTAPETGRSPAMRGFELVREGNAWNVVHLLVDALDRGDEHRVSQVMTLLRAAGEGPPPRGPEDSYTTYTWDEWRAEFGSGVTASHALEGEAQ